MSNLRQAIWVEALKARRSHLPVISAIVFAFLPVVGGLFMIIIRDPELARRVGLISAKAQITVGTADWPGYFQFLSLAVAVGGVFLFGIITSWVFGREYSDRTLKDILALPTPRTAIVCAKLTIIAVWSAALVAILLIVSFLVGRAVSLPPAPGELLLAGMVRVTGSALMTIALVTVVAFVASAGRGYLAPFGIILLVVILAQILSVTGWGEYFPWAVPGLYSQGEAIGFTSYLIVILTSLAGLGAVIAWWELADQGY